MTLLVSILFVVLAATPQVQTVPTSGTLVIYSGDTVAAEITLPMGTLTMRSDSQRRLSADSVMLEGGVQLSVTEHGKQLLVVKADRAELRQPKTDPTTTDR